MPAAVTRARWLPLLSFLEDSDRASLRFPALSRSASLGAMARDVFFAREKTSRRSMNM